MYTLIAFATRWGSHLGGINSFNADFLKAFGVAYGGRAQAICLVPYASDAEIQDAKSANVCLLPLGLPGDHKFTAADTERVQNVLRSKSIVTSPDKTIWLGHDRITGAIAIAAAAVDGRSAVIHHMSYDDYESFAEDSTSASKKTAEQRMLFQATNFPMAVGPLLRDALRDLIGGSTKPVHMLVPGLAEIKACEAPNKFTAFMSGRISSDTAPVKQNHLSVAAFAEAWKSAQDTKQPSSLYNSHKLLLRGLKVESTEEGSATLAQQEKALKEFAGTYASGAINLFALPFTADQKALHDELRASSVAMMPSWHEGFGLVAWEAIAAGVPLILGERSGVYKLLDEHHTGTGTGCVHAVNVKGNFAPPYFHFDDLRNVKNHILTIAADPAKARQRASNLREMLLGKYTWSACVEGVVTFWGWDLHKGSIPMGATPPPPVAQSGGTAPVVTPAVTQIIRVDSGMASVLHMPQGQWQGVFAQAVSALLRAEYGIIPFDPVREPEMKMLDAWLDDSSFVQAVRLLVGAGGVGKTRLALELCHRREKKGWRVGFLRSDATPQQLAGFWYATTNDPRPMLVVMDYAEACQQHLLALVKAMQADHKRCVRILLLARSGGEWWDALPGKDKNCESLLCSYATTGPFHLPAMYETGVDAQTAYQTALSQFAKVLGAAMPPTGQPNLAAEHFRHPLYVQMAALLVLHGEQAATAEGLTRALLNHERRYWKQQLASFNLSERNCEYAARTLLALATLAGGFPSASDAWPCMQAAECGVLRSSFKEFFGSLATLYPASRGGMQAVRPDLLGEALVAQALNSDAASHLLDAVLGTKSTSDCRLHALTVLSRLSIHRRDCHDVIIEALKRNIQACGVECITVGKQTPGELPSLLEKAFLCLSTSQQRQIAGVLDPRLKEDSVQFAKFACVVGGVIALKCECKYKEKPHHTETQHEYARELGKYALSLWRNGQINEALKYAERAIDIGNRQEKKNSRNEPDCAASLGNYAVFLHDAGRYAEAKEYAKRALDIWGRLVEDDPTLYEPEYATSLSNYANRLNSADRHTEAMEYAKRALDIRKRLAETNPDRHEPDYAASLHNYASLLTDVGRDTEAFKHAKQALDIWDQLAKKNPDRHEPDFARSLSNHANRLGDVGQDEEALEYVKRALYIREKLTKKNPDRYEPDFATS